MDYLTCLQAAKLLGISQSTVKRMCDSNVFSTVRTPGGHRRIKTEDVLRWSKEHDRQQEQVFHPRRVKRNTLSASVVLESLQQSDSQLIAKLILQRVRAGESLAQLFDDYLASAMWEVGRQWESKELDVFQEHLCTGTLEDVLLHISVGLAESSTQLRPQAERPIAIGCAVGEEMHDLSSAMIEVVLNHAGWNAQSLGAMLPAESLVRAIDELAPRIVWVSYTHIDDANAVIRSNTMLFESLQPHQRLVLGGQALTARIRRRCKFHFVGDSFVHLMHYVDQLERP